MRIVDVSRRRTQWRSQDLQVGGTGGLGNGSPPAGSMAEHLVGGSGGHSLPKARSSY